MSNFAIEKSETSQHMQASEPEILRHTYQRSVPAIWLKSRTVACQIWQ